MTRRVSLSLPLALLLAGAAPLSVCLGGAQDAPKAPKIAFLDLQRLFEADATLREALTGIDTRAKQVDLEIKGLRDELEKLRLDRDAIVDRASEKYLRLTVDIEAKQNQIKSLGQGMQMLLNHEADQRNLAAYERFRKVVAELAKDRGLDAVLRIVSLDDREPAQKLKAAEMGMVLYSDPKLDVTDDVIKLLKTK